MQDLDPVKKHAEFDDIRLSWVQRFYWVAELGSVAAAGAKCYVSATEVSESIQKLSAALCLPLMIPTTARLFAAGKHFARIAKKVLDLSGNSGRALNNVTVSSLRSLIAVQRERSYSAAARSLGYTRYKVMRDIKSLTYWVGEPIVYLGDEVRLTERGEELAGRMQQIIPLLERSMGPEKDPKRWTKKPRVMPPMLRTYGISSRRRRHANSIRQAVESEP